MRHIVAVLALAASTSLHAMQTEPHEAMPMITEAATAADRAAAQDKLRADFTQAYVKAAKPRIAVWFNRELSDRVEEWVTPVRIKNVIVHKNGDVQQLESSLQVRDDNDTARPSEDEDWVWAFEDGFDRPLLDGGVNLVDRTMILRLSGADAGTDADKTAALKRIEVSALRTHADLMIELLIKRAPDSKSGYNFRAKVVDVASGRVLAMVNAPDLKPGAGSFVTTDHGYERPSAKGAPAVTEVGNLLADEVMKRLTRIWK